MFEKMLYRVKGGFLGSERTKNDENFEQAITEAQDNFTSKTSMDVLVTQPGSTFAGAKMFGDFVNAE
jgi:hypothetical protein